MLHPQIVSVRDRYTYLPRSTRYTVFFLGVFGPGQGGIRPDPVSADDFRSNIQCVALHTRTHERSTTFPRLKRFTITTSLHAISYSEMSPMEDAEDLPPPAAPDSLASSSDTIPSPLADVQLPVLPSPPETSRDSPGTWPMTDASPLDEMEDLPSPPATLNKEAFPPTEIFNPLYIVRLLPRRPFQTA